MPPAPRPSSKHLRRHDPLARKQPLQSRTAPSMTLYDELELREREFITAVESGSTVTWAAFNENWHGTAARVEGALENSKGLVSTELAAAALAIGRQIHAVSSAIARNESRNADIRASALVSVRTHLLQAGASAFTPAAIASRTSIQPYTPPRRPKPSLHTRRTPSPYPSPPPEPASVLEPHLLAVAHHAPYRTFFLEHFTNPYPTASEKTHLLTLVPGDTRARLKIWFTNQRKRSGWTMLRDKWADGCRDGMEALKKRIEDGVEGVEEGRDWRSCRDWVEDKGKVLVSQAVLEGVAGVGGIVPALLDRSVTATLLSREESRISESRHSSSSSSEAAIALASSPDSSFDVSPCSIPAPTSYTYFDSPPQPQPLFPPPIDTWASSYLPFWESLEQSSSTALPEFPTIPVDGLPSNPYFETLAENPFTYSTIPLPWPLAQGEQAWAWAWEAPATEELAPSTPTPTPTENEVGAWESD